MIIIRQLDPGNPEDVRQFREMRLQMLREEPHNFPSDYDSEAAETIGFFESKLMTQDVFAAWHGDNIAAIAALVPNRAPHRKHCAEVKSVYTRHAHRHKGIARQLMEYLIRQAKEAQIEILQLNVNASNVAAIGLYELIGFKAWGQQDRALKIGDTYYAALAMAMCIRE